VRLRFENGSSGRTGTALVHTYWKVLAEPASNSFEAELRGTLVMVSGQTHLVGTITSGARRNHRVETDRMDQLAASDRREPAGKSRAGPILDLFLY
jgi:hypothetical protein